MQRVAVALIDALGFKGIWRRVEPKRVLDALRMYRNVAENMTNDIGQWPSPVTFHAQAISDSLIFAAASSARTPEVDQRMVQLLGVAVAATTRGALLNELPLAFRGHLAVGDGLLEDGILVGEAIDTAASNFERADAACVWLCPTARAVVESIDPLKRDGSWLWYDVPLVRRKMTPTETSPVRTIAVNPCGITCVKADHDKLVDRMHRAFDMGEVPSASDTASKRYHSAAFLERCSRSAKEWWAAQGYPDALKR